MKTEIPDPHSRWQPLWWAAGLARHEREVPDAATAVPGWALWVERVMANWPKASGWARIDPAAEPSVIEIVLPLRPFVDNAWTQVLRGIDDHRDLDLVGVAEHFTGYLTQRLVGSAARTLVAQLHTARQNGLLGGVTSRQRFTSFVAQTANEDRIREIFSRYPVLARLIGQTCFHAVTAHIELFHRLATDRKSVIHQLLGGVEPGPVVAVDMGVGDLHQGGRAVAVLRFASGARVVYKPRELQAQDLFGRLVAWFNAKLAGRLTVRNVALVTRPSYGWLKFVAHRPCVNTDEVHQFYRRLGALLALLHAVDATDIHYQNLIAEGGQPVLVDLETLFHPTLPLAMVADDDPALRALGRSVFRTALLPQFRMGDDGLSDISGVGGDSEQGFSADRLRWTSVGTDEMRLRRQPGEFVGAENRPVLAGRAAEPVDHLNALLDGFRIGYEVIVAHRAELIGPNGLFEEFAESVTRVVSRPTELYATLLKECTHPSLLQDGLDRDKVFDRLLQDAAPGSVAEALAPYEVANLWSDDIPVFFARPGRPDIWTSTGVVLTDLLDEPGLSAASHKTASLDELDRQRQEWLISAALGARARITEHHQDAAVVPGPLSTPAFDQQRLLIEACGIADEIVATAEHDERRTNWVGVELVDSQFWTVQSLGAGLANGYTGVALFLAQLGALTGATRYTELARKTMRPLPALIDAMRAEPAIARAVGPGAFLGLAGIGYVLSRFAVLDDDPHLDGCLDALVELLASLDGDQADLMIGHAGAVAALVSIHANTGNPAAGLLATRFATRLLTWPTPAHASSAFATGSSGVAFALARVACGEDRYLARARALLASRVRTANHGWCMGLAGRLMARAALSQQQGYDDPYCRLDAFASDRSPLQDLSLCHGELGVIDTLVFLGDGGYPGAMEMCQERTARMHAALSRYGPRCGTPNGVASPGLLTGLAGIGYGLLRVCFPQTVPSVLALEPLVSSPIEEPQPGVQERKETCPTSDLTRYPLRTTTRPDR